MNRSPQPTAAATRPVNGTRGRLRSIRDGWGLEVLLENPTFGEFSFHTYLNLVDIPTARMIGYSLAATDDELFELVDIYSQALKKRGAGLLSDDGQEWDRLRRAEELGEGLSEIDNSQGRFCEAHPNPSWE